MADGLPSALGDIGSESIKDGSLSTADLADNSVSGSKIASQAISTAKIAANAVDASVASLIGTGSPTGYGLSVQTGEFVAGAGSSVSVDFGTAFASAPTVLVQAVGGIASQPSASAGSVVIETEVASASGTYIAIGSGAI